MIQPNGCKFPSDLHSLQSPELFQANRQQIKQANNGDVIYEQGSRYDQ